MLVINLEVADSDGGGWGVSFSVELLNEVVQHVGQQAWEVDIPEHCIGLSGGGLSVHENSGIESIINLPNQFLDRLFVDVFGGVEGTVDIVELKGVVEIRVGVTSSQQQGLVVECGVERGDLGVNGFRLIVNQPAFFVL